MNTRAIALPINRASRSISGEGVGPMVYVETSGAQRYVSLVYR